MKLISVIIPIYKVERYLNKCIESVVQQTYRQLEIILVDDGSPDMCPSICDKWAEKDSRIKVVHKENGGLSDARNIGLKIATGEYISFIDSDDYINPYMYEFLMIAVVQEGCDVAGCEVQRFVEDEDPVEVPLCKEYAVLNKKEAMMELIRDARVQQITCNKIYQKSLIVDILFPVGKYHEDEFWTYQVIGKANRVAIVEYVGYNYLQRSDSIMGVRYSMKRLDAIEAKVLRQSYLEEKMPELATEGKINLLFSCLYQGQLALKSLSREEKKKTFKQLKDVYKKHPLSLKEMKKL